MNRHRTSCQLDVATFGVEKGKARAKLGEGQKSAEVIEGKEVQGTTEK